MFGRKLGPEETRELRTLAEQVLQHLGELVLRPGSRRRLIAKSLLRERALESGLDPPLLLIEVAVEAALAAGSRKQR